VCPSEISHKINVCVLYGGRSSEHEISLKSAATVIKNLNKNKFVVTPIAIDKTGQWLLHDLEYINLNETLPVKTKFSTALTTPGELSNIHCDVVFPVLHGPYGEDGAIQGLLEILDLPYVGAGVLGSAIGMDKDFAKRLIAAKRIPVLPYISFNSGQWQLHKLYYQKEIQENFAFPVFVKPADTGSSLGVSKVKRFFDLAAAIDLAFRYDSKILIEQACEVRELEVAVLENLKFGDTPLVSIPGEIIPNHAHEFYSYEAKYLDEKGAELVIPAVLSSEQLDQIRASAIDIFTTLACEGMARIDFFMEKTTQQLYFNEINTIPGFTKISMYPKLWEASGLSYPQLLTQLIELAIARHRRRPEAE
jgi:D-alanine-D-alanine ligase